MADGPNFSNLGVTDPTTGKPVFLSSSEIANVMGATGGVAPTQFQAATEGFIKGVGQGQEIVNNVAVTQGNFARVDATKAQTEAQNIENEIARQTQDAQIIAKNNQIQQQAIQAKIQTDKLTQDNNVLQAVRSGDPAQLTAAITNPATRLSALEQDQYIQSAFQQLKDSNALTPQQMSAFDQYNKTRDIFKQGPLRDSYQTAAKAVSGTIPFQQLKSKTGMDTNELLSGMQIVQVSPNPSDPNAPLGMQTALQASDGSRVWLNTDDEKALAPFGTFFSNREQYQNAGGYKAPLSGPAKQAPTTEPAPTSALPGPTGAPATQAAGAGALPPTPTATPAPLPGGAASGALAGMSIANPNSMSPTGQSLETRVVQLKALNDQITFSGLPVAALAKKRAQEIAAQHPFGDPKDAVSQGMELAVKEMKVTKEIEKAVGTDTSTVTKFSQMRSRLDRVIKKAESIGYEFGDSYAGAGLNIAKKGLAGVNPFDKASRADFNNVETEMKALASQYGLALAAKDSLGASVFNSNVEREMLQADGPQLTRSIDQLRTTSEIFGSLAQFADDKITLRKYLSANGKNPDQINSLIQQYDKEQPGLILAPDKVYDPKTKTEIDNPLAGSYIVNPNKKEALRWVAEKEGYSDEAVVDAFSVPATLPFQNSAKPAQEPAAGSGTATPFSPAKKQGVSAFPQPQGAKPDTRGANYDQSPATTVDLRAIADTVERGGNVKRFQTNGSVPRTLDKATPDLIARVVSRESSGRANAVSPTGVTGAMQVTQATYREMGGTGDRAKPFESIEKGTKYLNAQLKKYDGNVDLALASYNAGPGTVDGILEKLGVSADQATIEMLEPYLPSGQPTAQYVRDITSRGRVATKNAGSGKGFFATVNQELNPFAVQTAEAQELPSSTGAEVREEIARRSNGFEIPDNIQGMSPEETEAAQAAGMIDAEGVTTINIGGAEGEANVEGGTGPSEGPLVPTEVDTGQGTPAPTGGPLPTEIDEEGAPPIEIVSAGPTTDSAVEVPEMDLAPRGDTPPVSEIQQALIDETVSISKSAMPNSGRAIQYLRNSPVGAFLNEVKETQGFDIAQNAVNAITFGAFDEGMSMYAELSGLDGNLLQNEIRNNLKDFRKESPGAALLSEIVGSVIGGAGAGAVALALRGSAAAADLAPMTFRQATKIGAAEGAARGVGEGEDARERATGGALGGAMGAAGGTITKGVDAVGTYIAKSAPWIQKAVIGTVTKMNTYKGLQALGVLLQKKFTGKTPAEVLAGLTDDQVVLLSMLKHMKRGELKKALKNLKESNASGIPARLYDELNDAKINGLIKVMIQLGEDPRSAAINRFIRRRDAGQVDRMSAKLGSGSLIEQSAAKVSSLVKFKNTEAQAAANAKSYIYDNARAATPKFKSPEIDELLSIPVVQEAVAAAKASLKNVRPQKRTAEKTGMDLMDDMFEAVRQGSDLNTIIKAAEGGAGSMADNSFNVLKTAYVKLKNEIVPELKGSEHYDAVIIQGRLLKEMRQLNPELEKADAAYAKALADTDVLRSDQLKAISALNDGDIEKGLGKLMALSPTELKQVVNALGDPKVVGDAAKGYVLRKMSPIFDGKTVSDKLVTHGEWGKLEILLGKPETDALRSMVEAETKIAKSGRSVMGGSDTVPKGEAKKTMDQITGKSTPLEGVADIVAGSTMSVLSKSVQTVLRAFKMPGDPAKLAAISDTLVLSLPKGIDAAEKILRSNGLTKAEIRRIRPQLREWQATLRGGEMGVSTGMVGAVLEADKPKQDE